MLAADFDVLGSSQGSQIRILNGQRSANTQWRISLSPRRAGGLRIPPISVGGETTEALTLQVDELPDGAQGGPGDAVFVELELGVPADQVVVQQQVPIAVRLFSARDLVSGGLSEPRPDGAVLERLGEDRQYRTSRNGREYQVVERRYSLSPERSGELRIPPVVFEGEIEADGGGGSPRGRGGPFDDPVFDRMFDDSLFRRGFSMFERGEAVRAQSDALVLEVAASPDGFAGAPWLPAEALTITDDWADNPPKLRVGEPAKRTLTLTAKGLSGSQIPVIELPVPQAVRSYAETPERESRTDGATLFGVSRQAFTLIPTRAGTLDLPGLDVRWWDTDAQRERIARVPALSLQVAAGATAAAEPVAGAATAPSSSAADPPSPAPAQTDPAAGAGPASAQEPPAGSGVWALIGAAILGALGAAAAALLWWRRRQPQAPRPRQPKPPLRPDQRRLRQALRQACLADHPPVTAKALLTWAQAHWPERPPANLADVARRLPDAGAAIGGLERALYAPDARAWEGAELWRALSDAASTEGSKAGPTEEGLMPLYPPRTQCR